MIDFGRQDAGQNRRLNAAEQVAIEGLGHQQIGLVVDARQPPPRVSQEPPVHVPQFLNCYGANEAALTWPTHVEDRYGQESHVSLKSDDGT